MKRVQNGQCYECPRRFTKKNPGYRVETSGPKKQVDVCKPCYQAFYARPEVEVHSYRGKER